MKSILVVDDDTDIHELIKLEFKGSTYKVMSAYDEIEGESLLKEEKYHCVFLDIILGTNKTSHSLMRFVGKTPVFLMSAHITVGYKESILNKETNIVDCIKKPFKKGLLLQKVIDLEDFHELQEEVNDLFNKDSKLQDSEETIEVTSDISKDIEEVALLFKKDINEQDELVKGEKEDLTEESELVKGEKEDLTEESEMVKGEREDLTEESELVKGEREDLTEENQIVSGSLDDLIDDSERIEGDREDLTEVAQMVKGEREDLTEESEMIKGEREDLTEEVQVISSEEVEDESKTVVSGNGEEDENVLRLQSTNEETEEEKQYRKDIDQLKNKGPNSRTLEGYTRLMIAVLLGDEAEVEKAFVEEGTLEEKCKGGYTALHIACMKGKHEIAKFLVNHGAKLTAKDNENREPLYFAITQNQFQIAKFLVEQGAPTNRRFKGRTYLILAAIKKNKQMFDLMRTQPISLEVRDDKGLTVKNYLKKLKLEHFLSKAS